MTNLNEIKLHKKAVEQTRQITNAMYLLSTSKIRVAMQRIDYNLTYMKRLRATMKDIILKSDDFEHRYTRKRTVGSPLFIIVTSDKGMCGAYNSSVISCAQKKMEQYENPLLATVGMVGAEHFRANKTQPYFDWVGVIQNPHLSNARQMTKDIMQSYDRSEINEVYIVYTHYVNSAVQTPDILHLLPLSLEDYNDVELEYNYNSTIIYEPSEEKVFTKIVPQYMVSIIYDILNQSWASEYAARMNAMQTATKNADEMIDTLSAQYNSVRQFAITNEITEIAAASETIDK